MQPVKLAWLLDKPALIGAASKVGEEGGCAGRGKRPGRLNDAFALVPVAGNGGDVFPNIQPSPRSQPPGNPASLPRVAVIKRGGEHNPPRKLMRLVWW